MDFKREPSNHWKIRHSLRTPWVRAGFGGNIVKLEGFYMLDSYKKFGALEDEKDRCYLQRRIFFQKSKFQTIRCSKLMWDLLVYIFKGKPPKHWD